MKAVIVLAVAGLLCAGIAACQSSQSPTGNPTPAVPIPTAAYTAGTLPALGVYRLQGVPSSGDLQFTRVDRASQALADAFAVDITAISAETFIFTGIEVPSPGTIRIKTSWEHPLPDTSSRKDLSVFDFRLHMLSGTPGVDATGSDGLQAPLGGGGADTGVILADLNVLNADGWSSWADEIVEPIVGDLAPNLYPYVLVHEDSGRGTVDPSNPAGWNVVPQATGVYPINLDFPLTAGESIDFLLALDVSYGASAMKSIAAPAPGSRLNPRYFNPEFNLKEGWRASASVNSTVESGDPVSATLLSLEVFDHQGALPGSGSYDGATAPLDSLRFSSDLVEAQIAIPGAMPSPITLTKAQFTGDGTPTTPYAASTLLTGNELTGVAGDYIGVVAFVDEMRANAGSTDPLPPKGFDAASQLVDRHDFATYITFPITLVPGGTTPTWTNIHNLIANGDPSVAGVSPCIQCHVAGPNGLFMTNDKAATYLNLVNVVSTCGDDYIEPGMPAMSFLYEKISNTNPSCGLRMPQNGPPYWSAEAIAEVSAWITAGAPEN